MTTDHRTNHNPQIEEVLLRGGDGGMIVLGEGTAPEIQRGHVYEVEVRLDEDTIETFAPASFELDGEARPQKEALTLSWFVDGGETGASRTGFIDGFVGLEEATHNTWTAPGEGEESVLIVVVRDDRGGVDYALRRVKLVP